MSRPEGLISHRRKSRSKSDEKSAAQSGSSPIAGIIGGRGRRVGVSLLAMKIGVVGATGQVGSVMRRLLAERNFPVSQIRYFASARSAGTPPDWEGPEITVGDAPAPEVSGLALALFSPGATSSRELAPKFAAA